MAGQLKEVMAVICIFIAGFCGTYVTLPQLNGTFSFWDGAYLYKMAAPIVKGATTTMQDSLYGYLPCLGSMFSTEITSNIATMVTVPFLMSCYHQYDVYKGFTGRLQIASGQQCI